MLWLRRRGGLRLLVALVCALAASGCATHGEAFSRMEARLLAQQPAEALSALDSLSRQDRDQALYQLNRGMLLRMLGDYAGSIEAFEAAKQLGLDLQAISVTEELATLTLAEGARSYVPDVYERLLLHVYQALNFLEQGQLDSARVEALQIDLALRRLDSTDARARDGEDAFARYLTGLIYEAREEWSDAMIAYRLAAGAYEASNQPLPLSLRRALLRLTDYLALTDEHAAYRERFDPIEWQPLRELRTQGELVLLVHRGLLPIKYEQSVTTQDAETGQLYRIALPALRRKPPQGIGFTAISGERVAQGEQVEAVHWLAQRSLERQLPGLTARAIARNVAKHYATKRVREENPLLGLAINIAGAVAERADTRSWRSLPDRIELARLPLPPGEHIVMVRFHGLDGGLIAEEVLPPLTLGAGEKRFISLHRVQG